jgi:hypothetical protein
MPYQIVKQKDKKFKVCKADDKKVCFSKKGIPLKTAKRQIRAIVSSESKKGGARLASHEEQWWKDRYVEFEDYARNLGVPEDELYPMGVFKVKFEALYNETRRTSRLRVQLYDISTKLAQQNYDEFNSSDVEEGSEEEAEGSEVDDEEKEKIAEKFRIYLLDRPTQSKGFTFETYPIAEPKFYTDQKVGENDKYLNIDGMTELYDYLKNELENTPAIDKKRKAFIVNTDDIDLKDFPLIFAINKVKQKLNEFNSGGNIGNNICVDKCSDRATGWDMLGRSTKVFILGCYLDDKDNIVFTTVAECGFFSSSVNSFLEIKYLCSANYGFTVFKAFRELQNNPDYTFWPYNPFNQDSYLKLGSVSSYETVNFYWTQGLFNQDDDYKYSIKKFQNILDSKTNVGARMSSDSVYKNKMEAINQMRKIIKKGECNYFLNSLYSACSCGGNKFLFPKMLKEVGNSYKPISGTPDDTNHWNFNEGFLVVLDLAEEKITEARKKIGKLLPQFPEAIRKTAQQIKETEDRIAEDLRKQEVFEKTKRVLKAVPVKVRKIKANIRQSLRGKDINIPLPRSNVESIVPQGESGLRMNIEIPETSARNRLRNLKRLEEAEKRGIELRQAQERTRENFEETERLLRSKRPRPRLRRSENLTGTNDPRENYLDRIKPARPSTLKRQISRLRPSVLRTSGLDQIEGYGVKGTKFYEELRRYGINPTEYLKQMKKWAKASGYDDKQLDFANNDVHKLRIMTEQGTKRFGRVGYKDYYIYRHLEKKKEVKKGYAKIMRDRFRKSHGAITKKRKLGRNSANELSVRILWHEEDDDKEKK